MCEKITTIVFCREMREKDANGRLINDLLALKGFVGISIACNRFCHFVLFLNGTRFFVPLTELIKDWLDKKFRLFLRNVDIVVVRGNASCMTWHFKNQSLLHVCNPIMFWYIFFLFCVPYEHKQPAEIGVLLVKTKLDNRHQPSPE